MQLRAGAGDERQRLGDRAHHPDAKLLEGGVAQGEDRIEHRARVARLGGALGMLGQLEEMLGDLRRAPHLAMQRGEGAGALGVERAARQQVGQRADRGQPVVEGVQHVGGALVEGDVRDGVRGRGDARRGRRRREGPGSALPAEEKPDQRAHPDPEQKRHPQRHDTKILDARASGPLVFVTRPGGETGRHAVLRGQCRKASRFESGPGHPAAVSSRPRRFPRGAPPPPAPRCSATVPGGSAAHSARSASCGRAGSPSRCRRA